MFLESHARYAASAGILAASYAPRVEPLRVYGFRESGIGHEFREILNQALMQAVKVEARPRPALVPPGTTASTSAPTSGTEPTAGQNPPPPLPRGRIGAGAAIS